MHWTLVATILLLNNVISEKEITQNNIISNNNDVIKSANDNIIEGERLPDGRILILMTRDDLDFATALVESELACRKALVECAARPVEKPGVHWAWIAGAAMLIFLAGGAIGFAL